MYSIAALSRYYVHFRTNTLGKDMNSFFSKTMVS